MHGDLRSRTLRCTARPEDWRLTDTATGRYRPRADSRLTHASKCRCIQRTHPNARDRNKASVDTRWVWPRRWRWAICRICAIQIQGPDRRGICATPQGVRPLRLTADHPSAESRITNHESRFASASTVRQPPAAPLPHRCALLSCRGPFHFGMHVGDQTTSHRPPQTGKGTGGETKEGPRAHTARWAASEAQLGFASPFACGHHRWADSIHEQYSLYA